MSGTHGESSQSLAKLMLAALGVVYGDIGTSPLYALQEAFNPNSHHPLAVTQGNVLGVISLIVWSLLVIVTFKYVVIVLRADNHGEGGVVALMARVLARAANSPRKKAIAIALGIFGALPSGSLARVAFTLFSRSVSSTSPTTTR